MQAIPQDTEPAPIIWSYVDLNLQTLGSARLLKTQAPPPPLQAPSPSSSHAPVAGPSAQTPALGTPPGASNSSQSTTHRSSSPRPRIRRQLDKLPPLRLATALLPPLLACKPPASCWRQTQTGLPECQRPQSQTARRQCTALASRTHLPTCRRARLRHPRSVLADLLLHSAPGRSTVPSWRSGVHADF